MNKEYKKLFLENLLVGLFGMLLVAIMFGIIIAMLTYLPWWFNLVFVGVFILVSMAFSMTEDELKRRNKNG